MTTGQILRTAAQHIREHGWMKKNFGSRSTGMCLHGGIYSALTDVFGLQHDGHMDGIWTTLMDLDPDKYLQADNASTETLIALFKVIPDTCDCESIVYLKEQHGDPLPINALVYHYNDYHCTGGEDAALLLEQAAEKWEAEQ
jgi:hypothetical protein